MRLRKRKKVFACKKDSETVAVLDKSVFMSLLERERGREKN